MLGLTGSCTTAPNESVPSLSVIGVQDFPPFSERQTPPLLNTAKTVVSFVPLGSMAMSSAEPTLGPGSWPLPLSDWGTVDGAGPIDVHCRALPPYGASGPFGDEAAWPPSVCRASKRLTDAR